ncbi:heme ABC transporter ATP-binding protein [Fredinandcohnia quinoae]|uniref:Heme ABC transporter ATP-binding protein n=1 Tax=Fredinandcohnia quinoae TaxID=2918902 RepID=A0AAW5E0H9_9BACI|nr:heme ABC transporter ATP-binding protein [Fredinandcohnia sp. SECRCQ15]MCH1626417.1 heme ABC transporter ATP-binding protein [Fredinandcohnia sp. SECRCQ15]
MLRVQQLSGGYSNYAILKDVSFEVERGELFGILGPNGSGKTTLLKMISGILPNQQGIIDINGRSLSDYSPKQLAQIVAVLPQHSSQSFSYTVKETVSFGRYAHQKGWFQSWSVEDEEIVQRVMTQTGVSDFQYKNIQELSGGERQRVYLAQALAQEPHILLLDEPTNHLDLSYQKELLDLLKSWTKEKGLTVISIFHDLNLAGLYCDRLLLLEEGSVRVQDTPDNVLKKEIIKDVYNTEIEKQPHPEVPAPQLVLLPKLKYGENEMITNPSLLKVLPDRIELHSPTMLRTMSSGVVGSGTGWYRTFVNRHVDKDYNCDNHRDEMASYLQKNGYDLEMTVGMMTAVMVEDLAYQLYKQDDFSVFIVVTAGVGNAIDASKSELHSFDLVPGTINTWIFVNGKLTEEAYIQSIMTATESKVKVMNDLQIIDKISGTLATGTSTDSILIAATQKGKLLEFAGTISPLGKLISKGVYECTAEAIRNSKKRTSS